MAPRSRTGCLTCRTRKLKCSEEKPSCAQCIKANRECVPSSGITFRHQQNPSMNGDDQHNDSLKSFYGYKETFGKSATWVAVPPQLTFIHTTNPYEDDDDGDDFAAPVSTTDHFRVAPSSYPAYATHGLEALSAVATQQDQYHGFTSPPMTFGHLHQRTASQHSSQHHTSPQHQATSSQNLDFILNPASNLAASASEGNIDPRLHSQAPSGPMSQHSPLHVRTQSVASIGERPSLPSLKGHHRRPTIEDPELAFLLRDARCHTLAWMDLFDLDLFFAERVPVLAIECPLLLYSCASLSAKSLARVNGRRLGTDSRTVSRQSVIETWPGPMTDAESWVRKGRECYDIAVSLLRQSLAGSSRPPTSSLPEQASPGVLSAVQRVPLPTTDSDELVAATAILCVYEFLDASGPEWSRHLDGAKTLFDVARDQAVPLTLPPSPVSLIQQITPQLSNYPNSEALLKTPRGGWSSGRKAVYWCFARQDMLSAFINNTSTRLDTGDLQMWRSAGLKLNQDGYVSPSNPRCADYSRGEAMSDDMISNALVWLVMKLVNFIAAKADSPEHTSPLALGVRQREMLSYWESLEEQLSVWCRGLPDGFHPTVTRVCDPECESEKWFARNMAASTMMWYNFARIQLLHCKPQLTLATPATHGPLGGALPGTVSPSHDASCADVSRQCRAHAKDIVAITNARHDEGTRVHSVQPLWTAGLILGHDDPLLPHGGTSAETESWQQAIVGLLRGLERDLGWASEYRVESLLEHWRRPSPHWSLDKTAMSLM